MICSIVWLNPSARLDLRFKLKHGPCRMDFAYTVEAINLFVMKMQNDTVSVRQLFIQLFTFAYYFIKLTISESVWNNPRRRNIIKFRQNIVFNARKGKDVHCTGANTYDQEFGELKFKFPESKVENNLFGRLCTERNIRFMSFLLFAGLIKLQTVFRSLAISCRWIEV